MIDGDCVGLTDQSLRDKQIEWMRFLSVSGTPLFVSSKKGFADKAQQTIISKAFETNQMNNHMQPIYDGTITPNEYIVNGDKVVFGYDDAFIDYNDGTHEEAHQDENPTVFEGGKDYWGFQHARQIRQFYDAVLGIEPLEIRGEEALKTYRLIMGIYKIGKIKL